MEDTAIKTIDLQLDAKVVLDDAIREAGRIATDLLKEPLLVAWYDGVKHQEHPEVPECQHKPGWIVYAEGHGGKVRININNGIYSFIYADVADS